jgi:hypothetical protein
MFLGWAEAVRLRSARIAVLASGPIGAQPAAEHPISHGLEISGLKMLRNTLNNARTLRQSISGSLRVFHTFNLYLTGPLS